MKIIKRLEKRNNITNLILGLTSKTYRTSIYNIEVFCFMKKKKTLTRQDYIKELDKIFSIFIRLRDSNERWIVVCPLCWAKIPRQKAQNMHFISRGVMKYRYNEKNCHAGCMRCNVILHWNYIAYTRRMQKIYWISFVDRIISDKQPYKIPTPMLVDMIHYYQWKVDKLMIKDAKAQILQLRR